MIKIIFLSTLLAFLNMPATATSLNLEILRPEGRCLLNLSAEAVGPVWLPVNHQEAVQLVTEETENSIIVTISIVRDKQTIDFVTQYELTLGSKAQEISELESYDLPDWSLQLSLASDRAACGGCGCGTLCCDPNPGFCMSCGGCGNCCNELQIDPGN
jgi:hypothetical protein